jgi:hypothetical protein
MRRFALGTAVVAIASAASSASTSAATASASTSASSSSAASSSSSSSSTFASASASTAASSSASSASSAASPFYLLDPLSFAPLLGRDFPAAASTLPLFEASSRALTEAYYFRWRVFLSHVHPTGDPDYPFVVTEFAPDVPWAGSNNTIPCAAVHHVREGRWGRDASVMDSYTAWWTSGLPNVRHNYFASHAKSLLDRLHVAGRAANLALVQAVLPNLTEVVSAYLAGNLPTANAVFDDVHDCVWNAPGNEGQERSLSGPGCRPLVQSLLFGEAAAVAELCAIAGNASCAATFSAAAAEFQQRVLRLWNGNLSFFDTLQESSPPAPPSPPPPMPSNYALFLNASVFCCDQSPCANGHSTFLYEGPQTPDGCASVCDGLATCHFATVDPSGTWCQAAEFCNTTNPFAGGPAFTFARTSDLEGRKSRGAAGAADAAPPTTPAATTPPPFSGVRELASLSSPWYFGAVPAASASQFAPAWEAAFDPDGFSSPFGLRTAEARAPGYGCHPASCCWWSGPVWPFESSKVLTAAASILHATATLAPSVPQVTRARLTSLLRAYTAMHEASASDNATDPGTSPWLITNSSDGGAPADYAVLNASGLFLDGLGAHWIAEAGCGETGEWTDDPTQGYLYLHSSYVDVVLTAVVGLVPRAGDAPPTLTVHPLQASDGELEWWAVDGLLVGGRIVTAWWDGDGSRYGRGAGLHVLLDGEEVASAGTTQGPPLVVGL